MARQIALGLKRLDQLLERQILMRIGVERGRLHPLQQVAEGRIARAIGAHNQDVREETDQILELVPASPRDGRADDHVVLVAEARQQHLERCEQHHEQRGALAQAEAAQLRGDIVGNREPMRGAGEVRRRATRSIER